MLYDRSRELPPERRQLYDDLGRAIELLEAGWTRKQSHIIIDGRLHVCLSEALYRATAFPNCGMDFNSTRYHAATAAVAEILATRPFPEWLMHFNDTAGRTQDEVIAAVQQARERVLETAKDCLF